MVLSDVIKLGDKIDIQAADRAILGASAGEKVTYMSKVYDIIDDESFEVLMPMEGSKLILLPIDGEYVFYFYTKKGLFQAFIRIVDRYKSNNVYILLVEMTSKLEKYQRREYYRYSTNLPLKARELMEEEQQALEEKKFSMLQGLMMKRCTIYDISGGGLRFSAPVEFEKEKHLALIFTLSAGGKEKTYELVGKVLDGWKNEAVKGEFMHRLKFIYISNRDRESIIRYIFEEERKKRSRD